MTVIFTVSVSHIEATLFPYMPTWIAVAKVKMSTKQVKTLKSLLIQCRCSVVEPFVTGYESICVRSMRMIRIKYGVSFAL